MLFCKKPTNHRFFYAPYLPDQIFTGLLPRAVINKMNMLMLITNTLNPISLLLGSESLVFFACSGFSLS